MTVDEAIQHCKEVTDENECMKKRYDDASGYTRNRNEAIRTQNAKKCEQCAKEHRQLAEWLKELKKLREQQQWISCSERLPEEHEWIGTKRFGTTISDEVYVTFEALNGKRFCEHCRFQNGEISLSKRIEVDAISKGAKPVAWCELPQPWKGDKK